MPVKSMGHQSMTCLARLSFPSSICLSVPDELQQALCVGQVPPRPSAKRLVHCDPIPVGGRGLWPSCTLRLLKPRGLEIRRKARPFCVRRCWERWVRPGASQPGQSNSAWNHQRLTPSYGPPGPCQGAYPTPRGRGVRAHVHVRVRVPVRAFVFFFCFVCLLFCLFVCLFACMCDV